MLRIHTGTVPRKEPSLCVFYLIDLSRSNGLADEAVLFRRENPHIPQLSAEAPLRYPDTQIGVAVSDGTRSLRAFKQHRAKIRLRAKGNGEKL